MEGLPWFKIYAAELLSDERFMSWTIDERGAWITLLSMCWREGSIPADQERLARVLRVDSDRMALLWAAIGDRFTVSIGGSEGNEKRLTSPRLERERSDAMKLLKAKKAAGKKGAKSRWDKKNSLHGTANGTAIATAMRIDGDQPRSAKPRTAKPRTAASQTDGGGGLESLRAKLAAALGLPRVKVGKDSHCIESFTRCLNAGVSEGDLVRECVLLAQEKNVTPGHLTWWAGWLDTIPESKLRFWATGGVS